MNRFVLPFLTGGVLTLSVFCQSAARAQAPPRRLTPPPGSVSFGTSVTVLANGNLVVTDPDRAGPGDVEKAGAVYLYDGATLEIISTLTGSHAGDRVGGRSHVPLGIDSVIALPTGSFVVRSPEWNEGRGAVTWCGGAAGVAGEVSPANSLTGTRIGDFVGSSLVTVLAGGNYAVRSPDWNEGRGALTWVSGATGVTGEVSPANSLTGGKPRDRVGSVSPWYLSNGRSLWLSPEWNGEGGPGALTLMNADGAPVGEVSAGNSMVNVQPGRAPMDDGWLTELDHGNFLIRNPQWGGSRGAVTWFSGTAGVKGRVSEANSLIGDSRDNVGSGGIFRLTNGNYVVVSGDWNGRRGAITWGDGAKGTAGVVSGANSLINLGPDTLLSKYPRIRMTALTNGNYVVALPFWGSQSGATVVWEGGAVVWGSGTEGVRGGVSTANALIGVSDRDHVGLGGVTALSNGNYVVLSPLWNKTSGAATWCDGSVPVTGRITDGNSLTGVGGAACTALKNGHYVLNFWYGGQGAVTWGNGFTGLTGVASAAPFLTGVRAYPNGDQIGSGGIVTLSNGDYAVVSPHWGDGLGAVTWCGGSGPVTGEVTAAGSLTGHPGLGKVTRLEVSDLGGDRLLVRTQFRNESSGAASAAHTWIGGAEGIRGGISKDNSLIVSGEAGVVTMLPDGGYTLSMPGWNEWRGAVVRVRSAEDLPREISSANALTGTRPGDAVGSGGVLMLDNGNYLVGSRSWNGGRGAWTWASAAEGVRGEVSAANSHLGTPSFPMPAEVITGAGGGYAFTLGSVAPPPPSHETGPRGLFVAGGGEAGGAGYPTLWNSLRGSPRNPVVKPVTLWDRTRRRWVVYYAPDQAVVVFDPVRVMVVTGPRGTDVRDESISARRRGTDFGAVRVGNSLVYGFTLADAGIRRLTLTGNPPVRVTGAHAADFTVTRQPRFPFRDDGDFTFEITFQPSGPGPRAAVVSIDGDAEGEGQNPYTFPLQGAGVTTAREVFEDWRTGSFGSAAEGTAPAEDFDRDGVSNLLEFAFGTDPADSAGGPPPLTYTGPLTGPEGGALISRGGPAVVRNPDGTLTAVWLRRRDTLGGGLNDAPRFSADLQTWWPATAEPVVLASDGVMEAVAMPFPSAAGKGGDGAVDDDSAGVGGGDRDGHEGGVEWAYRFFRLAVTLEP